MATLAQLLDKPAHPMSYVVMPSSNQITPNPNSYHQDQEMNLDDDYDEIEIIYKRPFMDKRKNGPNIDQSIKNKSKNAQKPRNGFTPGSGLSLSATSLPFASSVFNSGHTKKPLPALSPIAVAAQSSVPVGVTVTFPRPPPLTKKPRRNNNKTSTVPINTNLPSMYQNHSSPGGNKNGDTEQQELNLNLISTLDNEESSKGRRPSFSFQQSTNNSEELIIEKEKPKSGKKNSDNKIKRPLNAFMVWSKFQRRRIMDTDPTMHHSLISKQLGAGWKALSPEEREPYYEEAKRLGELHTEKYPDYKYRPRQRTRATFPPSGNSGSNSPQSILISSSTDVPFQGDLLLHSNKNVFRQSLDGSLDLSLKRPSKRSKSTGNVKASNQISSTKISKTAFCENDSTELHFEMPQPLNMSLKSGQSQNSALGFQTGSKSWSQIYAEMENESDKEESEDDDDRLVIDE